MEIANPCLACGACCAFYRVSFYWGETDDVSPQGVPVALTEKINDFRVAMRRAPTLAGSGGHPRCLALRGFIGKRVSCSIYPCRASVCRDFAPAWENGQPNPRCDLARAAWNLAPLLPGQWDSPGNLPKAA